MEIFFLLMNSVIDFWKMPCSMSMLLDIGFGIMLGVGLFYLLIPFLKLYPESPPPGREKNIPKVVKMGQSKARKKTATIKGCRNFQKNAQDTQNAPWPMESPTQHPLLDSSPHSSWNPKEKLNQLPLPWLFSNLKALEDLIQPKFNQLLGGISSVFSESVVATAWVSRKSSSGEQKTVRFSNTFDTAQALPLAKNLPQLCQDQPLSYQLGSPSLVGVTEVQEQENLPSSIPNQTPPSFQCRTSRKTRPYTEIGIQTSLPNINGPGQPGLNWKEITAFDIQKCQVAIDQPIDNLSMDTQPIKAIRSASILPEHYQIVHHHEDLQHEEKVISMGEQQEKHVRHLPSGELPQLQGAFQTNSGGHCKNPPEFRQPAQPFILSSESYKWIKIVGSVLTGMLLKKAITKYGIPNTIKKVLSFRYKDLPCTSSSTPGKGLEPENPPLRTDKPSTMNTTEDLSFLDPKTQMKLESNTMQFPEKHSKQPDDSKAEFYSKAAKILEKLHHQDPGGTKVETLSSARLQSPLFKHSSPEVQKIHRAPSPAVSHGPSKSHPDQEERYVNVQPNGFCFQEKPQQCKSILGTGRGILKRNTSPKMSKHATWKMSEDVISGHPCWNATSLGPDDNIPPSEAKETNTLKVKEEPSHTLRVNLGSGEIPDGQAINLNLKDSESIETKKSPGNLQTPTPQNSGDLYFKTKEYSNFDLSAHKQSWPVSRHPDGINTAHPDKVRLLSQHSLLSFQNGSPNHKTWNGLGDLLMSSDQSVNTPEITVHTHKINAKNDIVSHPHKERPGILKSGGINQGEMLGRVGSIHFKDTDMTEIQSSLNIAGQTKPPSNSSLKNITRNATQYENLSTKYKEQGDSLKEESPLPVTEQMHKVDRVNLIYSRAFELQALINTLVQNLENNVDGPSKLIIHPVTQVQEDKAESVAFQLVGPPHSSEVLHDPNHSKPARTSRSHTSPEEHSPPFTYSGSGDKLQSGVDAQRVCEQYQNKVKGGLGFVQLPTPMGNDYPCCYRGDGNKQESGLADQKASDPGQSGTKIGMGDSPHGSPKGHNHLFRYREITDKREPVADHKIFEIHQNTKIGVGRGPLMSPKDNFPVKDRGSGVQEQLAVAAQGVSDPAEMRTKRGKECSPHRSPEMHSHSLRLREVRDESQPSVNAQRVCDQHLNSQKRTMAFGNLTPKENNHPCQHRVTGDKQQIGLADQNVCDPGKIRMIGMGPCPQRSPKGHKPLFRYREVEENVLSFVHTQRTHDKHLKSVKRRGFDKLPTAKGNNHPHSYKVIRDKQQSGIADKKACDPGQIRMSGMGPCPQRSPKGHKPLLRYREVEENVLSSVRTQRTHDEHPNSVKRRDFDKLPTAKGNNHPHSYKVIIDKQPLYQADLRACDPVQIIKSGLGSCVYRYPEGYNFLDRCIIGNKEHPGIVHRACDPHQRTKQGVGHGQPKSPRVNHSVKHRETGGQDKSAVAGQGACGRR